MQEEDGVRSEVFMAAVGGANDVGTVVPTYGTISVTATGRGHAV